METRNIPSVLDFSPRVKELLIPNYDFYTKEFPDLGRILWETYDGVTNVRMLEILISKVLEGKIPPGILIDIQPLLNQLSPGLVGEVRQIMEQQFQEYPQYFSKYVISSANNVLMGRYLWKTPR